MSSVGSPIACCQKLADDDFDEKARLVVLKALADPVRLRIVTSLAQSEQDSMCACSMPDTYGVSQPTLSHHLKKLVEAGVLRREQRGNWAHFSICPDTLVLLRDFIGGLIQS